MTGARVTQLTPVPEDVRAAVERLVTAHGLTGARMRLGVGWNVLDELRCEGALVVDKTLARVRTRLVTIGELVSFGKAAS